MSLFNVIRGILDNGSVKKLSSTAEGHLEVAVHAPRLPFGSVHTEGLTPVFQTDAVYGLNSGQVNSGSGTGGSATASDSSFTLTTGTSVGGNAFIQSRKRLRYRAGQGVVGRFAGLFTAGVADSYQVIGFGHAEDGFYFGYKGTTFGIIHNARGQREIQTLTVTTASSTTENITITLDGTANSVAVTNSGNIQRTVWEIASATYTGWKAYAATSTTVVFVADAVGNASGSFTLSGTTAVGTFAETRAGAAVTETFIAQSSWNGDKLDGIGASGVTLDPTKGNVYEIGMQYLGYGAVEFKIKVTTAGGNNADYVTVHTIKNPNTLTATHVRNPSFPFTMAAYSTGSTTNLTVKVGSFGGFIEGNKQLHGNRFSYFNSLTTVGATNIQALITIWNKRVYGGIPNQAVVNLLSLVGAIKHTSPVIYYLIKNGTLGGNPSFADYTTNSCTVYDTAATTVSYSTNDQLLATVHLGDTGDMAYHFDNLIQELTIQPGEWVTLGAKAVTGTPSYVTGAINTREDQ